jgi:excisionase family DNA binding protein
MVDNKLQNRLMTVADVAEYTRFSVPTIRKHILNKTIPFHRVNGRIRFFPQEIVFWIRNEARVPSKQAEKTLAEAVSGSLEY